MPHRRSFAIVAILATILVLPIAVPAHDETASHGNHAAVRTVEGAANTIADGNKSSPKLVRAPGREESLATLKSAHPDRLVRFLHFVHAVHGALDLLELAEAAWDYFTD